jgi:segregation and condensation protein B
MIDRHEISTTLTDDDKDATSERRIEHRRAIEAMLFVAEDVLAEDRMVDVISRVTGEQADISVSEIIAELNADYALRGSALHICRWDGGFRLASGPEADPYVQTLLSTDRSLKLSRSLLETLAVIAYRQPVTRPEIEFVRGVDSDYAVRKLLELRLVDVVGRSESLGRPLIYGTTGTFLEQFGIDSLDELPTLREIEEILQDPAFDRERARLFEFQQQEAALEAIGSGPGVEEETGLEKGTGEQETGE